ncbi:hypothetical protein Bca52824_082849 [Brassica carinata]|uniref:Uncharacterized protein n=1 Tax=Brassica carinata TaxID=52824 RepID=A0A8X7PLD6_BRACI|nr:hypothetical protein Bca52824_082849 [Brassica carinata]
MQKRGAISPSSSQRLTDSEGSSKNRDSPCSCGRRESCYPGMTASCRSSPGELLGGVANDPFMAYQEAAKVMSTKKGSSSRSAYGDEVMVTGSRRSTVVKLEPFPSLPGKKPKSGGMTTRSVQQLADMARSVGSLATALSDQKLNVFPQDGLPRNWRFRRDKKVA